MRSGCRGVRGFAAIGPLALSGVALGSTELRTVVLDDFSGYERDQRWTAQIGSDGHVAYITRSDAQVQLWDGATTEVLHEIGTHLEGLAPGVTTDSLTPDSQGSLHHGRILGVDREGGVSVTLYAGPEPSQSTSFLASTVLGGGFRAIMVPPDLADQTGVVRSSVNWPFFGMRRSDSGYTRASGVDEDGVYSHRVFSPDLSQSVIWSTGGQVPGGTVDAGQAFSLGDSSFGIASHFDHAGSGSAADLVRFTADGGRTFDNGVLRTQGAGDEMLLRSGTTTHGLQLLSGARPLVRVNQAGQTLVAAERVFDPDLGTLIPESLLLYDETGEPERLLQRNESIPFINFQPRPYNPPSSNGIRRRIAFGNDGSAIFDITGGSDEIAHRGPSGVYTMLLAPDAELLGVPGATVGTDIRPMVSLDATSAASVYMVDGVETLFHATPAGVTRIVGAGDEVEVAPGVFQTVIGVFLLDVNAEHLLFNMTYTGGRAMIAATVPTCPADLNNDGVADADDFFLFLNFFATSDSRADINTDGIIDADDFFAYLDLFAQGC